MISKYLSVGNACNLKCKFCYNDLSRDDSNYFESLNDLSVRSNKIREKYNYIIIIGGEPFMYTEIEKLLLHLYRLNFKNLWIVTNGIRLSDIKFAAKLFKYRVNNLEFSIHSLNEKMEKEITQRSGLNFIKREEGIKNIIKLNNKFNYNINLNSNTVINSLNYKYIGEIIMYIDKLGIEKGSFSFIYNTKGMSYDNKSLLVKYSDVIDIINNSKIEVSKLEIEIDWLPFCLHKKIKGLDYKIREELSVINQGKDYKFIDTKIKKKVKLKQCSECTVYGKLCNGVFKDYTERFGELEFNSLL